MEKIKFNNKNNEELYDKNYFNDEIINNKLKLRKIKLNKLILEKRINYNLSSIDKELDYNNNLLNIQINNVFDFIKLITDNYNKNNINNIIIILNKFYIYLDNNNIKNEELTNLINYNLFELFLNICNKYSKNIINLIIIKLLLLILDYNINNNFLVILKNKEFLFLYNKIILEINDTNCIFLVINLLNKIIYKNNKELDIFNIIDSEVFYNINNFIYKYKYIYIINEELILYLELIIKILNFLLNQELKYNHINILNLIFLNIITLINIFSNNDDILYYIIIIIYIYTCYDNKYNFNYKILIENNITLNLINNNIILNNNNLLEYLLKIINNNFSLFGNNIKLVILENLKNFFNKIIRITPLNNKIIQLLLLNLLNISNTNYIYIIYNLNIWEKNFLEFIFNYDKYNLIIIIKIIKNIILYNNNFYIYINLFDILKLFVKIFKFNNNKDIISNKLDIKIIKIINLFLINYPFKTDKDFTILYELYYDLFKNNEKINIINNKDLIEIIYNNLINKYI